jgi:hypothetical protein
VPRRGRKDSTQDDIASIWSGHGFWVLDLHDAAANGFAFEFLGRRIDGGIADLLCLLGTFLVCVECKATGGKLDDAERAFRDACDWHHVPYLVEYSVDEAEQDAARMRAMALRQVRSGTPWLSGRRAQ